MSKSRDSRSRRRSQLQRRARLRRLVWARVGPLAQRDPLFSAFYQTAATVHHLAYNYLICAERAHCNDDKCLRDRGHPGLPPWPEHLARVTFADDNSAISALTAALAVRQFAMRMVADVIAAQEHRVLARVVDGKSGHVLTVTLKRQHDDRSDLSLLVGPKL